MSRSAHELIQQHGSRVTWLCTQCGHIEACGIDAGGILRRVVLAAGNRDADHDGAARLVQDEARYGLPVLPRISMFGALVDELRRGL